MHDMPHDIKPITREIRHNAMLELVPQKKRAYYARVFTDIEDGHLVTMNWGAAFWSFMWFFYHRMFMWGWGAFFIFMVVDHAGQYILGVNGGAVAVKTIDFFAPIVVSVMGMGFFANYIYYQHLNKMIRKSWFSRGQLLPEETWHQALRRKGGVDLKSAVLATLLGLGIYVVKTMVMVWLGFEKVAGGGDLQQQLQQIQGLIH